jgi:hypothetical protein
MQYIRVAANAAPLVFGGDMVQLFKERRERQSEHH